MIRDRSTVFIAFCDLLFAVLAVVIVQVSQSKSKVDGVQERALFLVTIEWSADIDADVDDHLLMPDGKPVFFGARQHGLITLDTDNKGLQDSTVTLADGSRAKLKASKEIIKIGGAIPGSYVAGVNLYAYRDAHSVSLKDDKALGLHVHCEIVAIEPNVHLVFSKDLILDRMGQTINWASFDLDSTGELTLTDPPLEPITDKYIHSSGGYTPGSVP